VLTLVHAGSSCSPLFCLSRVGGSGHLTDWGNDRRGAVVPATTTGEASVQAEEQSSQKEQEEEDRRDNEKRQLESAERQIATAVEVCPLVRSDVLAAD
jgi:hypothetical protein